MTEQITVAQLTQLGMEATNAQGTKVAATDRLLSTSIVPAIKADVKTYGASGYYFAALAAEGKESCEAKIEGGGNYNELVYPLCSLLKSVTPTGASDDKTWTFAPSSTTYETVQTFTVEHGSALRAGRFGYGLVHDFGMDVTRDEVKVSGAMIGQLYEDNHVLSGSCAEVPQMPMLPNELCLYADTTAAGLGVTKLTRVLAASWRISDKYAGLWALDSANTSWVTHVDKKPKGEVKLTLEADAVGMGLLVPMRLGDSRFIRFGFLGAQHIGGTAVHYAATLDFCGKIENIGELKDQDGVYALEYTFGIYHDVTWAKALSLVIVNAQAAL